MRIEFNFAEAMKALSKSYELSNSDPECWTLLPAGQPSRWLDCGGHKMEIWANQFSTAAGTGGGGGGGGAGEHSATNTAEIPPPATGEREWGKWGLRLIFSRRTRVISN